jgi:2'-5' RNA ligase
LEKYRAFVAIDLPDELAGMLAGLQARLKAHSAARGVNWVKPGNIHLTLKFLGAMEAQKTGMVAAELKAASTVAPPLTVSVEGVGGFPSLKDPRVVWVGVKEDPMLLNLQEEIEGRLSAIGFEKEERPFHPHLTIGRARTVEDGRALGKAVMSLKEGARMDFRAEYIVLYRSELEPGGARYTALERIALSGRPR